VKSVSAVVFSDRSQRPKPKWFGARNGLVPETVLEAGPNFLRVKFSTGFFVGF